MNNVCVFCGSNSGNDREYAEAAVSLAAELTNRDLGLVYGGGDVGLMGVLANAVLGRGGRVIGVIPESMATKEIAHWELTELRVVGSMHERKTAMYEASDAFIALPGGIGTLEEIFEVLTWSQLGVHRKPCGFLNIAGYYDSLLEFLDQTVEHGFIKPEYRATMLTATRPGAMLDLFDAYEPPPLPRWLTAEET